MSTGLEKSKQPRLHFDIYAVLEGAQELYLGNEVQVNVNLVEVVKLQASDGTPIEKCYISPTKRRGVERRCLLWAPTREGELLGDKQKCGIPKTCAEPKCPICGPYGALDPGKRTLIGRVTHGGGVAIQELYPVEKQRAMHPAIISNQMKTKDEKPTPFRREYNQPGLLYPVYNHALSVTDTEFSSVAYAFLDSLARIGSGNPKGVAIAEFQEKSSDTKMPLLVVDRYLSPRGKRPVLSPAITDTEAAIDDFLRLARSVGEGDDHIEENHFERWIGNAALQKLQDYSASFVEDILQA